MSTRNSRGLVVDAVVLIAALEAPPDACAGMPVVLLNDLARMRFQTISFFLLVLLACTWVIQRIWNGLRSDFPSLPRLDFKRALGLVAVWGLLFVLVLTMIAGARELMTPGAWRKQGLTYALAEGGEAKDESTNHVVAPTVESAAWSTEENDPARRESLDRLRVSLWKYALAHQSQFPASDMIPEIPERAWQISDPAGLHFVYRPGLKADEGALPLAYEPGLFGPDRWVLLTDGSLKKLPINTISAMISSPGANAKNQHHSDNKGAVGP